MIDYEDRGSVEPSDCRRAILHDVRGIEPFDQVEAGHRREAIRWIESGVELCRRAKPATPPRHLVSYFALTEEDHFLLVEHRNAGLWLPTGGHVEPGEHPIETARREAREELGIEPSFLSEAPLFITAAETVGRTGGHTDVSLWYVVLYPRSGKLQFDQDEFKSVRWLHRDELPLDQCDPHMSRFVQKLESRRSRGREGLRVSRD